VGVGVAASGAALGWLGGVVSPKRSLASRPQPAMTTVTAASMASGMRRRIGIEAYAARITRN
jgi:hypothetical protein